MTAAQILDRLFEGFSNAPKNSWSYAIEGFKPMTALEIESFNSSFDPKSGFICHCKSRTLGIFSIVYGSTSKSVLFVVQVFAHSLSGLEFTGAFTDPSRVRHIAMVARANIMEDKYKTKEEFVADLQKLGLISTAKD